LSLTCQVPSGVAAPSAWASVVPVAWPRVVVGAGSRAAGGGESEVREVNRSHPPPSASTSTTTPATTSLPVRLMRLPLVKLPRIIARRS
jgi:hypothetical protein